MNYCPGCGAPAQADAAYCSKCGRSLHAVSAPAPSEAPFGFRDSTPAISPPPEAAPAARPYAPASGAAVGGPTLSPPTSEQTERPVSSGTAIAALLLNILVWPGLGSLVAGENVGWAQGFLFLGGIILAILFIGIPMAIGAWIWALVTGIRLIQRADAQAVAR